MSGKHGSKFSNGVLGRQHKKKARFYFYFFIFFEFFFFFSGTHNLGIDVEIPKKERISKKQKISAFIVAAWPASTVRCF